MPRPAMPGASAARDFRRTAIQRAEDARILLDRNRTTGAMYLAGYAVECILKALVLQQTPRNKLQATINAFRGHSGHNLEGLRTQFLRLGGEPFSKSVSRSFLIVNTWSVSERYLPGLRPVAVAREFLAAVMEVLKWADARLGND